MSVSRGNIPIPSRLVKLPLDIRDKDGAKKVQAYQAGNETPFGSFGIAWNLQFVRLSLDYLCDCRRKMKLTETSTTLILRVMAKPTDKKPG
jgi:hypothetical protein